MFQKLSNSWDLVKASARVLAADKELLIFPIISAIGTMLVTLTFALPMVFAGFLDQVLSGGNAQVIGFVVLFLFYLAQYFVIFFCNTALVGAAMIRLRGGDPTLRDGFRIAFSRFGPILGYALIAATVGMILKAISERSRGLGRMVISMIGFAWNIATYLVVPVLAVESVGPIEAIRRSVALLKKTWGEQIAGNLGLGAVFGLATILLMVILLPIIILIIAQTQTFVIPVVLFVVMILMMMLLGLLNGALSGIYTAAVYQYAVDGQASGFFDPEMVKHAFQNQS